MGKSQTDKESKSGICCSFEFDPKLFITDDAAWLILAKQRLIRISETREIPYTITEIPVDLNQALIDSKMDLEEKSDAVEDAVDITDNKEEVLIVTEDYDGAPSLASHSPLPDQDSDNDVTKELALLKVTVYRVSLLRMNPYFLSHYHLYRIEPNACQRSLGCSTLTVTGRVQ